MGADAGAEQRTAVAAPVNEDVNAEEDEGTEENALIEGAADTKKKVAKAAATEQNVAWIDKGEQGTNGNTMHRCASLLCDHTRGAAA